MAAKFRGYKPQPPKQVQLSPALQQKFQQALALHRKGMITQAKTIYEEILKVQPKHFDAMHLLGVCMNQTGQLEQAEGTIAAAIKINSSYAPAYNNRGNVLKDLKRLDEALASYDKAISLKPDYAEAYNNRGNALNDLRRLDEALASYDKAISLKPDYAEAYYNRGNALNELGRLDEALASYDKAISLKSDYAEAYSNSGRALNDLKRHDEALASYDKAISLKPDYAEAYNNRGNALNDLRRLDEALASYDKAISLKPDYAEAYNNRGNVLKDLKRLDEALASYDKAISLKSDYAEAYKNNSYLLLSQGKLQKGWIDYEWRKLQRKPKGNRSFSKPLLNTLVDAQDQTVLVHWEQGLGDTIQFCRYARELERHGARVRLAPQKKLLTLMRSLGLQEPIVDLDNPLPSFDYHIPLMSLPKLFNTSLQTIPASVPYLVAEPERRKYWSTHLCDDAFKIGICWQGSVSRVDVGRSFTVNLFNDISRMDNVRLISLHKGEGEKQLKDLPFGMRVETLGSDFDSGDQAFLDTAAVMMCLDLIITSDTSIAHLAGALGRPVWVALKHVPDWRWFLDREDSPWYPTARLFRQKTSDDWTNVFEEIECKLRTLMSLN